MIPPPYATSNGWVRTFRRKKFPGRVAHGMERDIGTQGQIAAFRFMAVAHMLGAVLERQMYANRANNDPN
ncbi:hypothetical protein GCM10007385_21760 [Tateyamaria omphalii]|nr:hypothetical protein GCM10007385_21760 [Tateyamaria omphalii]